MDAQERTHLGVLGALADGDDTLEGIRETLQHNVGRHVTAGHGALGPALSELEAAGHVERDGEAYSITAGGEARLSELLRAPLGDVDDPTGEPQLRTKLVFLHHLPPAEQRAELDALADRIEGARNEWIDVQRHHASELDEAVGYRRAMFDLNARVADAYLEWIEDVRDRLAPSA